MGIAWGIVLVLLGTLAWGGQALSSLRPRLAQQWSLMEAEDSVEPAFYADVRGEAAWDVLSLWTLPVAGVLLALDVSAWAYLGLVGGAVYAYFGGRGIASRIVLRRRGFRVGEEGAVKTNYAMLAVWGVAGLITVVAAIAALPVA